DPLELFRRERLRQRRVRKPECGRGVGAAAAEPAGDRDALPDAGVPQRLRMCACRESLERTPHERVVGKTLDAQAVAGLDGDAVAEGQALVHGGDLVLAVSAAGAYDERQVDLGGGGRAVHRSASASAAN